MVDLPKSCAENRQRNCAADFTRHARMGLRGLSAAQESSTCCGIHFEALYFLGKCGNTAFGDGIGSPCPSFHDFVSFDPHKTCLKEPIERGVESAGSQGKATVGKLVYRSNDGVAVSRLIGESGEDEKRRFLKHLFVIYR
jgi:hypothetical protein